MEGENIFSKLERKDTSSDMSCPGCGISLAMRLIIESLEHPIIVGTSGCSGLLIKNMNLKVPFVYADSNPVALAQGLASNHTVCIAGDGATEENLASVLYAAQKNDNILYICLNNHGYCNINEHSDKNFAEFFANHTKYVATASLANPEDLVKKIQKASKIEGFRFIEILCPCPSFWGFDSSDTILISRLAVETCLWPLYEVESNTITLTEIAGRPEPVTRFTAVQKKFRHMDEKKIEKLQQDVIKKWKRLRKT